MKKHLELENLGKRRVIQLTLKRKTDIQIVQREILHNRETS